MNSAELLSQIAPSAGAKFSPNLHRWLRVWSRRYKGSSVEVPSVYRYKDRSLWIGHLVDCDKTLIGCSLIGVLCNGAREDSSNFINISNPPLVADFWDRYVRDGRCAIDEDHSIGFLDDKDRWQVTQDGAARECLWCGHHTQMKQTWTETITKTEWVSA